MSPSHQHCGERNAHQYRRCSLGHRNFPEPGTAADNRCSRSRLRTTPRGARWCRVSSPNRRPSLPFRKLPARSTRQGTQAPATCNFPRPSSKPWTTHSCAGDLRDTCRCFDDAFGPLSSCLHSSHDRTAARLLIRAEAPHLRRTVRTVAFARSSCACVRQAVRYRDCEQGARSNWKAPVIMKSRQFIFAAMLVHAMVSPITALAADKGMARLARGGESVTLAYAVTWIAIATLIPERARKEVDLRGAAHSDLRSRMDKGRTFGTPVAC